MLLIKLLSYKQFSSVKNNWTTHEHKIDEEQFKYLFKYYVFNTLEIKFQWYHCRIFALMVDWLYRMWKCQRKTLLIWEQKEGMISIFKFVFIYNLQVDVRYQCRLNACVNQKWSYKIWYLPDNVHETRGVLSLSSRFDVLFCVLSSQCKRCY